MRPGPRACGGGRRSGGGCARRSRGGRTGPASRRRGGPGPPRTPRTCSPCASARVRDMETVAMIGMLPRPAGPARSCRYGLSGSLLEAVALGRPPVPTSVTTGGLAAVPDRTLWSSRRDNGLTSRLAASPPHPFPGVDITYTLALPSPVLAPPTPTCIAHIHLFGGTHLQPFVGPLFVCNLKAI